MDPSRATSAERFLPGSASVAAALGPGPLGHVPVVGSTNTVLADEARAGRTQGAVLVADHQTAGRGRLDRVWVDEPGASLLVSLRIPVPVAGAALVTAAVSAAARAAVDSLCPARVSIKWPNDLVVVDGDAPGKLAGVLAEFVAGEPSCVVVGVGVNLDPRALVPGATSVAACGGSADRDAVLTSILRELAPRLTRADAVVDELRRHSATLGRRVRVELPDGSEIVGTATALADDGRLVVVDRGGTDHTVATGDVIHLRTI